MKKPKDKHAPYVVRPSTAVLTRGFDPSLSVGSARPAVFRSSTYVFSTPESAESAFAAALGKIETKAGADAPELIYSRLSHPNAEILEDQIVPLEQGAQSAAIFNSGMAAISTVFLTYCHPGSTFITTVPVYGGTHHFMHQMLEPLGIHGIGVHAGNTKEMVESIQNEKNLKLIYIETPANPTLTMSDISAAVEAARKHPNQPFVVVDNTFMGPAFQHPLRLGADLVVYSATKYLSGHSDMLGGVVLANNQKLMEQLRGVRAILGNILQPDECWLLNSRLPMVMLRMYRQSKNAQRIVESLLGHPAIDKFHYPTLFEDAEQVRIRDKQCSYSGGLFALEIKGGKKKAFDVLRALSIFKIAVSLGGVESLTCHPATTTHSEMTDEQLKDAGIPQNMVRFSIGVEDWRDLLDDIRQALDTVLK